MPHAQLDLLQGTLDLLILRTLTTGPMHGWAISQRIQQVSQEVLRVNQGSLYPALHRLEEAGAIAAEWGRSGVRVNSVSPGFTRTPALDKGVEKKVMDIDHMVNSSAFGRLVEADEIAAAVAFLASDLASGMTGVNVPVDAGYLVATPWMSYGGVRNAAGQQ